MNNKDKLFKIAAEVFDVRFSLINITRKPNEIHEDDSLGDLSILQGVTRFPARIKCATLSWHALQAALDGEGSKVSTE